MATTSTIPITIGTTLIQFPATGSSPVWSEAIIQFAQAVAIQLQSQGSPFDIPATVQTLSNNANASINLNGNGSDLSFPSSSVRSFTFTYAIYRFTTAQSIVDTGIVSGVYNSTNLQWELQHEFSGDVNTDGTPWNTFDINSSDELLLTTVALPSGTYNASSTISYYATTNLVTA